MAFGWRLIPNAGDGPSTQGGFVLDRCRATAVWVLLVFALASVGLGAPPQRSATKPEPNARLDSGELNIVAANVQLLLIAPDGKETGYDPKTKKRLRAIPESTYDEDALLAYDTGAVDLNTTQTLNVRHPVAGKYRLVVSSGSLADGQEYEIRVHLYRSDGSEAANIRLAAAARAAKPATYEFDLRTSPESSLVVSHTPTATRAR
jgi:hypothetical protein